MRKKQVNRKYVVGTKAEFPPKADLNWAKNVAVDLGVESVSWELQSAQTSYVRDAGSKWPAQPCLRAGLRELSTTSRAPWEHDEKAPSHVCGGGTSAVKKDMLGKEACRKSGATPQAEQKVQGAKNRGPLFKTQRQRESLVGKVPSRPSIITKVGRRKAPAAPTTRDDSGYVSTHVINMLELSASTRARLSAVESARISNPRLKRV
jgi:hypothetical protein